MSKTLKVGFFGDVETLSYNNLYPVSVAEAAEGIEEGSFDHSPERPFMKYTVKKNKNEWIDFVKEKIKKNIISKGKIDFDSCLKDLGEKVKLNIQETMTEAEEFATLSENTINIREKEGVASDNPFIATGGLRDSVEARIE